MAVIDGNCRFMPTQPLSSDLESLARAVLAHFRMDHGRMRLDQPVHARGFSGALIVRIRTDDVAYCLRRWPARELPKRRLQELHWFLRYVDESKLHLLPVPVTSLEGETLIELAGNLWQLEPWMPGCADFSRAPSEARLESVMNVLAQLHCVASQYAPTEWGRKWFSTHSSRPSPAVRERIVMIDEWTPAKVAETLAIMQRESDQSFRTLAERALLRFRESRNTLRASLVHFVNSPVVTHPCLRDIWHDHVLYSGDDVSGLVDPSATRTESVASDLSRLLGSLLGKRNERWNQALEVYHRLRPLSMTEHQLIQVLHTSGVLLSGLTWIDRRIKGQIDDEILPRVVKRMTRTAEVIDQLRSHNFPSAVARRLL